MATKRIWLRPENWVEVIQSEMTDADTDYEFVFEAATYTVPQSDPIFRHPSMDVSGGSGKISLTSHFDADARIGVLTGGSLSVSVSFLAPRIFMEGITFFGSPYDPELGADGHPGNATFAELTVWTGGDRLEVPTTYPTDLTYVNVHLEGAVRLNYQPSMDPTDTVYTDILLDRCSTNDLARNGGWLMMGFGGGVPAFDQGPRCHALVKEFRGHGRNGPDSTRWGAGVPWALHRGGTASLEIFGISGTSTFQVINSRFESHIHGSWNHDSHCFRVNMITSPDVVIDCIDCSFEAYWWEGHHSLDGGGIMWTVYYHPNNTYYNFPDLPVWNFVNCKFKHYIDPSVEEAAESEGATLPRSWHLYQGASSEFNMYDCRFIWEDPGGWITAAPAGQIRDVYMAAAFSGGVGNSVLNLYNTTWNVALGARNPIGGSGGTDQSDTWINRRIYHNFTDSAPAHPSDWHDETGDAPPPRWVVSGPESVVVNGGAEDGNTGWLREAVTNEGLFPVSQLDPPAEVHSGTRAWLLLANNWLFFGSPMQTSQDLTQSYALPVGTELDISFWIRDFTLSGTSGVITASIDPGDGVFVPFHSQPSAAVLYTKITAPTVVTTGLTPRLRFSTAYDPSVPSITSWHVDDIDVIATLKV